MGPGRESWVVIKCVGMYMYVRRRGWTTVEEWKVRRQKRGEMRRGTAVQTQWSVTGLDNFVLYTLAYELVAVHSVWQSDSTVGAPRNQDRGLLARCRFDYQAEKEGRQTTQIPAKKTMAFVESCFVLGSMQKPGRKGVPVAILMRVVA